MLLPGVNRIFVEPGLSRQDSELAEGKYSRNTGHGRQPPTYSGTDHWVL